MRKAVSLFAKVAVSGLLLYFALDLINIDTVRDRFRQVDIYWIVLGLLVLLIQAFALAARWALIVTRCGADLSLPRSFHFTMIAAFFNQTLPSSMGGDAIRLWLVGKHANWRVAAYSVFLDRVVGVVALAGLVVICLPWTLALVRNQVGRVALIVIGFGSIAAGLVFIAFAWTRLHVKPPVVADAPPRRRRDGRSADSAYASRTGVCLQPVNIRSSTHRACSLVRSALGGRECFVGLFALSGLAGGLDFHRPHIGRRLGRP